MLVVVLCTVAECFAFGGCEFLARLGGFCYLTSIKLKSECCYFLLWKSFNYLVITYEIFIIA